MGVKALILDADGVLTQPLKFAQYLKLEYPNVAAQTGEFFAGVFGQCLVGKADLREVLPPYLEKWGWPHSLDDFIDRWFEEEKGVDERLIDFVRAVRASGVGCYVATNQESHRLQYMRERMGFDDIFDGVFGSASIGFVKPDANFYQVVTDSLGLPIGEILFWDDTQRHVDAAIDFGWQAGLYTGFEGFLERTREVLNIQGL